MPVGSPAASPPLQRFPRQLAVEAHGGRQHRHHQHCLRPSSNAETFGNVRLDCAVATHSRLLRSSCLTGELRAALPIVTLRGSAAPAVKCMFGVRDA